MNANRKEHLEAFTPREAYQILIDGNERFIKNLKVNRNLLQQMNDTADGQYPFAAVLSCMDSRTSAELIFDLGLGDIFSIRIAGNIVSHDILGSMEYACKVVGSKLIVVLGHTRCGAIKGAFDGVELGHLTNLLKKIHPAIHKPHTGHSSSGNTLSVEKLAYSNVIHSMDEILERSAIIRELFEEGKIGLVGGMYSVENGRVHFIKEMFADEETEAEAVHNPELYQLESK